METQEESWKIGPRVSTPSCLPFFSCGFLSWGSSAKVGSASSSAEGSREDFKSDVASIPESEDESSAASHLRVFSFNDLKAATRNFRPDSLLGEGGFGHVFKGWIDEHSTAPVRAGTGLVVAVKALNTDGLQGHKEWLAEVGYLGEHQHPNLVKLIGYCIEGDQRLLVYEFMQKGSLENHLFRRAVALPWTTRMRILWGAAVGVAFLHSRERPVIYRDFKASNVLLDLDYNAKLSDFGLAKDGPEGDETHVSTRVMGTFGYAAPEYVMTGHLTARSDVYSFGVVLLEVITGRRSMDPNRPRGEQNLVEWSRPFLNDKKMVFNIVDPRMNGKYSLTGVHKAANLVTRCLARDPKARPSMEEVVKVLALVLNSKDTALSLNTLVAPPTDAVTRYVHGRPRLMGMVQS